MTAEELETRAAALWAAAADAAVKGGEQPPVGGWAALSEDMKNYYRALAGGVKKARIDPSLGS